MSVYLPGLPGDLILFSPPNKNINIVTQTLFRFRKSKYSHVAIVVEQYNVIHAMPKSGVRNEKIRTILNSAQGDFVVYRNTSINTEERILKLQNSLNYFKGQFYNYGIGIRSSWNSSFCSELAAKAFNEININISNKFPHQTLPSDIYDTISTSPDWVDITNDFQQNYLGPSYLEVYDVVAKFYAAVEDYNQGMSFGQKQLLDRVNAVSAHSATPTNYKPARDYWTNNLGDRFSWVILLKRIKFTFISTTQFILTRFKKR